MKKKIFIVLLLILLIIGCIFSMHLLKDVESTSSISTIENLTVQLNNREGLEEKEGEVLNVTPPVIVVEEPSIPGFKEIETSNYPMNVFNNDITIRMIGRYSGPFVEDGSNQNVDDVFGIVLHNNSNQMIEACFLTFENQNGTTLQFNAGSIPANSDIFVLESNRNQLLENDTIHFQQCLCSYVDHWHEFNDLVEVKCINQAFELKNLSDQNLNKIYVCYKNKVNDIYFGGITYRVTFNNIEAKQSYTKDGLHFNMLSEVVYINGEK